VSNVGDHSEIGSYSREKLVELWHEARQTGDKALEYLVHDHFFSQWSQHPEDDPKPAEKAVEAVPAVEANVVEVADDDQGVAVEKDATDGAK
jgi:hypothetical protein